MVKHPLTKSDNVDYSRRNEHLWRLLIALLIFIGVLSVIILGLAAHVLSSFASSTNKNSTASVVVSDGSAVLVSLLPGNVNTGTTIALMVGGIGGTIDSLLLLLILAFARGSKILRKRIYLPFLFILFVSVVRCLTALSYGWGTDRSDMIDESVLVREGGYPAAFGTFTPYGWSSQMGRLVKNDPDAQGFLDNTRRIIVAVRALSIPLTFAYIVAFGLGWFLWIQAKVAYSGENSVSGRRKKQSDST